MDREPTYPLGEHARDAVRARTGRRLEELTLDAVRAGGLTAEDLAIHPDTLRRQAEVAQAHGYPQLAANLRRAAELALVPQQEVLAMYEGLRPYRLKYDGLLALAQRLEAEYGAVESARLVREAAEAYRARGLA